MSSHTRLTFIEIARVFGILVVVLGHTAGLTITGMQDSALYLVISPLIRFVVPLFFMISGLVLGLHHRNPDYHLDAKRFWRRRLHTLVLPFLAWNIVYMFVLQVAQGQSILNLQTLFNLTTGYVHLYFVFVLLQFLLLYTFLSQHFSTKALLVSVFLAALSSVAFYAISDNLLWTLGADQHQFEWHYGKLSFAWAIFFFWGLWLGYSQTALDWLRRHQWWLLLAAVCAYVPYFLEARDEFLRYGSFARDYFLLAGLPYQFIAANWLLGFLYGFETRMRTSPLMMRIAGFGPYVFGVYVAHFAVLVILVYLWNTLLPATPADITILIIAPLTLLLTIAFMRLCYLPPFKFLSVILFGARGGK